MAKTKTEEYTADEEAEGNVQDISVHDKNDPSLAATVEAQQSVSERPPIIVPMSAFIDPENPITASGSINMALEQHPVPHSPDFGADYEERDGVTSAVDAHATETREMLDVTTGNEADAELRATDWKEQFDAAETPEELAEVKQRYDAAGASFKTADDAHARAVAAFESDDDEQ